MIAGIYKLIVSSLTQELRLDNISNNLANINTNAFKRDIISFEKMLTMKSFSTIDFSPGAMRYTGNTFDIALEGHGFFKIQTPRGIQYTRDGSFFLNADRRLVTRNGDPVLGQNGPIRINGSNVIIKHDGGVVVEHQPVDKISVVDFKQPQLLRKRGRSYYVYQGDGSDIYNTENTNVRQHYIEGSNVHLTEEMIKMLETLRAFESTQKAMQCMMKPREN